MECQILVDPLDRAVLMRFKKGRSGRTFPDPPHLQVELSIYASIKFANASTLNHHYNYQNTIQDCVLII